MVSSAEDLIYHGDKSPNGVWWVGVGSDHSWRSLFASRPLSQSYPLLRRWQPPVMMPSRSCCWDLSVAATPPPLSLTSREAAAAAVATRLPGRLISYQVSAFLDALPSISNTKLTLSLCLAFFPGNKVPYMSNKDSTTRIKAFAGPRDREENDEGVSSPVAL